MRGRTSSIKISLTSEQREALASLLRRQKTPKEELLNKQRTVNYDYPYPACDPPTHGSLFIYVVVLIGLGKRARAVLLLALCESFSQTSERVGLGERHLRSLGKTFYRAGSGRLTRASPTGESPGFPPLKWRCIW
jgi:hypothetical protein